MHGHVKTVPHGWALVTENLLDRVSVLCGKANGAHELVMLFVHGTIQPWNFMENAVAKIEGNFVKSGCKGKVPKDSEQIREIVCGERHGTTECVGVDNPQGHRGRDHLTHEPLAQRLADEFFCGHHTTRARQFVFLQVPVCIAEVEETVEENVQHGVNEHGPYDEPHTVGVWPHGGYLCIQREQRTESDGAIQRGPHQTDEG